MDKMQKARKGRTSNSTQEEKGTIKRLSRTRKPKKRHSEINDVEPMIESDDDDGFSDDGFTDDDSL